MTGATGDGGGGIKGRLLGKLKRMAGLVLDDQDWQQDRQQERRPHDDETETVE